MIPPYKAPSYPDWAGIDFVFFMIPLSGSLLEPRIVANSILQAKDREAIRGPGAAIEVTLSSYYAIEEWLTFLDERTRA